MMTTIKQTAKQYAAMMLKADEQKLTDLAYKVSGDDNRFFRQEIALELTGEKKPLVKCGISHLMAYASTGISSIRLKEPSEELDLSNPKEKPADKPKATETKAKDTNDEPTCKVGQKVIRKECQRKGKVTAIEGDKVIVELEDGSKRNPNKARFMKLYVNA